MAKRKIEYFSQMSSWDILSAYILFEIGKRIDCNILVLLSFYISILILIISIADLLLLVRKEAKLKYKKVVNLIIKILVLVVLLYLEH